MRQRAGTISFRHSEDEPEFHRPAGHHSREANIRLELLKQLIRSAGGDLPQSLNDELIEYRSFLETSIRPEHD